MEYTAKVRYVIDNLHQGGGVDGWRNHGAVCKMAP